MLCLNSQLLVAQRSLLTRTDFTENDWTEIWLYRLTPLVKRGEGFETLIDRYQRFASKILFAEVEGMEDMYKSYREKLLGPELIANVPPDFSDMIVIEKVGFDNWELMDLSERGKWKAFFQLKNMEELLREHLRLQKQEREERQRKLNDKHRAKRK